MRSDGIKVLGLFNRIHVCVLFHLIRSFLIALNQRLERVGVSVRERVGLIRSLACAFMRVHKGVSFKFGCSTIVPINLVVHRLRTSTILGERCVFRNLFYIFACVTSKYIGYQFAFPTSTHRVSHQAYFRWPLDVGPLCLQ